MGSEMSAEQIINTCRACDNWGQAAGIVSQVISEAEERGYQRGKAERSLSPEQRTCMEREGLTAEEITSDWADLKLEGDALRERLRSRAHIWKRIVLMLVNTDFTGTDDDDRQYLVDLIYYKERNCTMEADRLWNEYLTSLETLCETPEGSARLYAEVGATYAAIVIDRAAKRRMREDNLHIPTIEELAMEVQQEVS